MSGWGSRIKHSGSNLTCPTVGTNEEVTYILYNTDGCKAGKLLGLFVHMSSGIAEEYSTAVILQTSNNPSVTLLFDSLF